MLDLIRVSVIHFSAFTIEMVVNFLLAASPLLILSVICMEAKLNEWV